jgi:hypothetical protein
MEGSKRADYIARRTRGKGHRKNGKRGRKRKWKKKKKVVESHRGMEETRVR